MAHSLATEADQLRDAASGEPRPSEGALAARLPRFIPELDGMRAFAIVPVLFLHCQDDLVGLPLSWSRWGWVGVDLFFVISGFLITGILLDSRKAPGYFRNFYARRILRIWPLYFGLLFVVLWLIPHTVAAYRGWPNVIPWYYYVFFVQNLLQKEWGLIPLSVTWSLAVEEQFYVAWPMLVRIFPLRAFRVLLALLFVAAPVVRLITLAMTGGNWFRVFIATPSRMDAIVLGSLTALLVRDPQISFAALKRVGRCLCAVALPLAAAALAYYPQEGRQSVLTYSLIALSGMGIVLAALTSSPNGVFRKLLRSAPLVYIGRISYGLYLLHRLVFLIYHHSPAFFAVQTWSLPMRSAATLIGELAALFGVASLSWFLFEKPTLRLKSRFVSTVPVKQARAATA